MKAGFMSQTLLRSLYTFRNDKPDSTKKPRVQRSRLRPTGVCMIEPPAGTAEQL